MGDEITQPAQSEGFVRAKYLREALRRGSPPSLHPTSDDLISEWQSPLDQADPVIQKGRKSPSKANGAAKTAHCSMWQSHARRFWWSPNRSAVVFYTAI